MISGLGKSFDRLARRFVPDPMVLAIFLTGLTFLLGVFWTGRGPLQMLDYWYQGFWDLLAFAMQMCLILLTGYALATAPPLRRILDALAALPRGPVGAVWIVALTAILASLINWGLGLIAGALMAREVGKVSLDRGLKVPYPILGAAGYMGLLVWHGGLSGSIPLLVATPDHFLQDSLGLIPTSQTLFTSFNLILLGTLTLVILGLLYFLIPKGEYTEPRDYRKLLEETKAQFSKEVSPQNFAQRLNRSPFISSLLGLMGLAYTVYFFLHHGWEIDLNIMNFLFLALGLLLHGSVRSYGQAAAEGARACSGIIVQFPIYSGIMGMMQGAGLVQVMAATLLKFATAASYPIWAFLSAGLINLFIPSGGGQWAVQGPVMVEAAVALQASLPKTVLAVGYGESWTNMLQPFWALALLGITKLKAGEIIGYTSLVMLVTGVVFLLAFGLFPV
ncbi:MAG: TIGR00366 family protein [bacterium]|nr:TIGR00366 family protein [bacterium]